MCARDSAERGETAWCWSPTATAAYERYVARTCHHPCTVLGAHAPDFERGKDIEPVAVAEALERIGELYACRGGDPRAEPRRQPKRAYRLTHAKPVVDAFFDPAEAQLELAALLPSNPLSKALHYALERSEGLSVYLSDPDVPIDTNHLERALRPIPLGSKLCGPRDYAELPTATPGGTGAAPGTTPESWCPSGKPA